MKKLFYTFAILFLVFTVNGQTTIKVLMHDGPRSEMNPIPATAKYRITVALSGLDTDDQVKAFVAQCKLFQGVTDIFVMANSNGFRNTTFEFDGKKDKVYFEKFLNHAGITALIFNNKEYQINEIDKLNAVREEAKKKKEMDKKKDGTK